MIPPPGARAPQHQKAEKEMHDDEELARVGPPVDGDARHGLPHRGPPGEVTAAERTERALLNLFEAYQDLKRLGWNDAIYCPKDGTWFDAIEAGSTGIHNCQYQGQWPNGGWWVADGDVWPSRPILFRLRQP